MFISFILIPWLCALLTATTAAPLGALLGWRRLIYFGEAIAHASLLGIALALTLNLPIYLGIWLIALLLVALLYLLKHHSKDDSNNILGTLSHISLALGLIVLSSLEHIRTDLMGYLFGDILTAYLPQLYIILIVTFLTALSLRYLWQPLILMTLHPLIAQTELKNSHYYDLAFLLILALFVGVMVQFFGLLLVIALLIIPANAANKIAKTPEQSVALAILIASLSTTLGIALAWQYNYPVAPAIVVIAGIQYFIASLYKIYQSLSRQRQTH